MVHRFSNNLVRPPVATSLGCHYSGAALPHPDPSDTLTMLAGVAKRFAYAPPIPDPLLLEEFRAFVHSWIADNLVPLSPDVDVSFESWLAGSNYPEWRRQQLRQTKEQCSPVFKGANSECERDGYFRAITTIAREGDTEIRLRPTSNARVKSFQKDESYATFKHARGINSRHDAFKCRVGPIVKLIEKSLFKLPWFIKYVPVRDRARHIIEALERAGCTYTSTDYSQYESHFTKQMMEVCEFQLYDFMTSQLSDHNEFMLLMRDIVAGLNVCHYRDFTILIDATRMSGEMNTSLGNGFANLMLMLFVLKKNGNTDVLGFVEGDDGIFRFEGPAPTIKDFEKCGFTIKLDSYTNLTEASFCGIVSDIDDRLNVTNPIEQLLSFGWTNGKYALAKPKKLLSLLRSKSLSLLYQYPGCPVLQSLALYGLRMTSGSRVYIPNNLRLWHREKLIEIFTAYKQSGAVVKEVPMNTRILVEKLYKISVDDQISIEKYLDGLTELIPLDHPAVTALCHPDQILYWNRYVQTPYGDIRCPNIECGYGRDE